MNMLAPIGEGQLEPFYQDAFAPYEAEFSAFWLYQHMLTHSITEITTAQKQDMIKACFIWAQGEPQPDRAIGDIDHRRSAEVDNNKFRLVAYLERQQALHLPADHPHFGLITLTSYNFHITAKNPTYTPRLLQLAVADPDKLADLPRIIARRPARKPKPHGQGPR